MRDIGNANWWGRQLSFRGWTLQVRVRREGRRQTHRQWLKVQLYNYNYSEEAREKSRDLIGPEDLTDETYSCEHCGEEMEVHDEAGRCPIARDHGKPVTGGNEDAN